MSETIHNELNGALRRAAVRINSGLLATEAQVAQAVIVPTLRALDWDDTNPAEFLPQYPVPDYSEGRGWADFALLRTGGAPLVFVEAKRVGGLTPAGQRQLFEYANGRGVPLLVLTDGDVWDFYLSMAAGAPAERRFYRAELRREEKIADYSPHFDSYLRKSRVLSGKARRAAEEFHESARSREEAKRVMPAVWQSLLEEPDDILRDLLVEAVESKCGTKPDLDDAGEFLGGLARGFGAPAASAPVAASASVVAPSPSSAAAVVGESPAENQGGGAKRTRIVGYVLDGQPFEVGAGFRVLAEILKALQRRSPGFMPKYAAETRGRIRRLVAQDRETLYNRQDLLNDSVELEDGWWMGTYLSSANIRQHILTACKVAGIKFGGELALIER